MQTLEDELDRGRDAGGGLAHAEVGERLTQAVELWQEPGVLGRGDVLACVHGDALVERGDQARQPLRPATGPEHLEHRRLDDALQHLLLAAVVERLELDLACRRGDERVEVADPRHHLALAAAQGAS